MVSEKATITFTADVATAKSSINTLKDSVGGVEKKTTSSTASMVKSWAKVAGGIYLAIKAVKLILSAFKATVNAVKAAVVAFTQFQRGMAEVATISDTVAENQRQYNEQVRALAMDFAISATDAARGLYMTISAGITDAVDASEVLNRSLAFGQASLTTARDSVDLMTTVLNSYGLEAGEAARVSDVLFTTVRLGKTTGPELAQSLGRVIPIAARAGVDIENLSTAMVSLTRAGLSTQEASTALRQTLVNLIKPSKGSKDALEELGLEFYNVASVAEEGGLIRAMRELGEKAGDNIELVGRLVPNVRALTGVMSLMGQTDSSLEILKDMRSSMGATGKAVEIMRDTFDFQFKKMETTFQVLKSSVGESFLNMVGFENVEGATEGFESFVKIVGQSTEEFRSETRDVLPKVQAELNEFVKWYTDHGMSLADATERSIKEMAERIQEGTLPQDWHNAGMLWLSKLREGLTQQDALDETTKQLSTELGSSLETSWGSVMTPKIEALGKALSLAFGNVLRQTIPAAMGAFKDYIKALTPIITEWGAAIGNTIGAAMFKAFKAWVKSMFTASETPGWGRGWQTAPDIDSGMPEFAQFGGMVHGRGGRDAVPASLTSGEFVMRREAVDSIGPEVLEAINSIGPSTMNVNLPNVTSEATALQASPRLASGFSRFGGAGGVR